MGVIHQLIGIATCAAACCVLAACGSDTPAPIPSPECTIRVYYSGPPAGSPIVPLDPMCPHHYAPVNLNLDTDWGASIRLKAADDEGHYAGELQSAPTGADHWLVLYDIQWCAVDASPVAKSGVALNGVTLTRLTTTSQGVPALGFRADTGCTVHP